MARLCWDSGILTHKTVLLNSSNITLFEKTNKIFYLSYVSVPNSGNVQTADTKRARTYAELSIEMKQQWQVEEVYTSSDTVCNRHLSSHTA